MECELCYNGYDTTTTIPKLLKPCGHTYCNNCLQFQKQKDGGVVCPTCKYESKHYLSNQSFKSQSKSSSLNDPETLPINQSLLKIIEFRRNERVAMHKMKTYQIENPKFFREIDEIISRRIKPYQLQLSEITQDELIYKEEVVNPYLDKRTLGYQTYPYKTYVLNQNSLFLNYFFLNACNTRFLFLFRRLNGCQHKHSCVESVLRKMFEVVSGYCVLRVPLHAIMGKLSSGSENSTNPMDSKWFIGMELAILVLMGSLRSAGCFVRFMNEEIIQQS
eukprot:403338929